MGEVSRGGADKPVICIGSFVKEKNGRFVTNLKKVTSDGMVQDLMTITSNGKKSAREQYGFFKEDGVVGCDGKNPDDIFKGVFL